MNPTQQQSNLELLPAVTFLAGETKVFYLSGSYFELIDCANAVDVLLTDRSGGQRARMIGAAQTHHVKNTPYEVVQITSARAQTIRFAYGSGEAGTRNTAGSVSIANTAGAYTNSRQSVGTGAVVDLLAANTVRRYCLVQNTDAANYLRLTMDGSAPTAAQGIRVAPGDYWECPAAFAPTGKIRAIAETGTVAVEVVEG